MIQAAPCSPSINCYRILFRSGLVLGPGDKEKAGFSPPGAHRAATRQMLEGGNSAVAGYCEREQMCLFNKCVMIACSVRASSQCEIQRRLSDLFYVYGRGDRHVNSLPKSGPQKSAPGSRGSREDRTGQAEVVGKDSHRFV